jgi:hypothetical protein
MGGGGVGTSPHSSHIEFTFKSCIACSCDAAAGHDMLCALRCAALCCAALQAVGAHGAAGWIAHEMGMGKTAIVLATTVMNPPPPGG